MADDQTSAPLLDALAQYSQSGSISFGVPGHKSGRGATSDIKRVVGAEAFAADEQLKTVRVVA